MANGPVSIRDVARKAGVSVGTASLALNNRPYVSPQARQRVLSAVDEHHVGTASGLPRYIPPGMLALAR